MSIILYHNPRCSKSREALKLLEAKKLNFAIKEYLKSGLERNELLQIKNLLNKNVRDFTRTKESVYAELNLADKSEDELIQAIVQHPILLERPIVLTQTSGAIGRPIENINAILPN